MVRADLDSPELKKLRETALSRCTGIPTDWPERKLTEAEIEQYAGQNRFETLRCASASRKFINRVTTRDQALTGKKK